MLARGLGPGEWIRLPEFPRYEINANGEVRRRLTTRDNGNGYQYARFARRHWGVHVLVCLAFHGPKPHPKAEAAHWDNNRANNTPGNLRWATRRENEADKARHGTMTPRGIANPTGKLTDEEVIAIRVRKRAGEHAKTLSAAFGVHEETIRCIARGAKRRYVKMPDILTAETLRREP